MSQFKGMVVEPQRLPNNIYECVVDLHDKSAKVWLDVAAVAEDAEINIQVNGMQLLGSSIVPKGSWLCLFNGKLFVNKKITIRSTVKTVIHVDMELL